MFGNIIKRGFELRNRVSQSLTLSFSEHQDKTLRKLLIKASETQFGNHYRFKKILSEKDIYTSFSSSIPIHNYDSMHNEWWKRALENEENVTWNGKIKYFALSSGTSGSPSKHIPITDEMLRSNKKAGTRMFFSLTQYDVPSTLYTKGMMMLGGSTDLQDKGGYFVGDLSGINARNNPFWLRRMYKPGVKIAAINNWNDRIKEIIKQAPDWDIGFIMGIPAWNQLMIERIVEHYKVDSIHDIWPNLQVYVHGGVSFEPYRKNFEGLMSKPMIYLDTYLASEGFLAFQARPDTNAMALIPNNGIFFEFIPFNNNYFDENGQLININTQALNINQVELNKDYALVISTNAGAWRYLIGDTIRFTNIEKAELIITGRTKHFLSICGEHLSVDNMETALQNTAKEFGLSIPEYTVLGVKDEQFFAHKWYIACNDFNINKNIFINELDQQLKNLNDDYKTEREGNVLRNIQLKILPSKAFVDWFEQRNKLGGQSKFPRVLKGKLALEWEQFTSQL